MKTKLFLALLTACTLVAGTAHARKWTDQTGTYSVEAELLKVDDGKVHLKKADGQVVVVPVDRLSQADRRYLESMPKPSGEKEEPAAESKPARTSGRKPGKPRAVAADRAAIEQALRKPTKYAFVETPLADAVAYLANFHSIEAWIDKKSLDDVGISEKTPITAKGDREPLEQALQAVLNPLKLTWLVRDDVLFITTPECAGALLETRVYRLMQPVQDWDGLITQITRNVAPKQWDNVGGPGSIAPWPAGALIISQTYAAHRALQQRFGNLLQPIILDEREAEKGRRRGPPAPLTVLKGPVAADFVSTPLAKAVESLAQQRKVKVAIDEKALKDCGVSTDTPVSLRVHGVPLSSALALLLRQVDLTWVVDKNGLLITTPEDEETKYLTEVNYDVRDLVAAVRGDVNSLVDAITSTVAPTTWDAVGGPGSIKPAAGGAVLAVRQSFHVHWQLERLLSSLRQVNRR